METSSILSVREAFSFGFQPLKKQWKLFALFSLIPTFLAVLVFILHIDIMFEAVLGPLGACKDLGCMLQQLSGVTMRYLLMRLGYLVISFLISALMVTVAIRVALDIKHSKKSSLARVGYIFTHFTWRLLVSYLPIILFSGILALPSLLALLLSVFVFSDTVVLIINILLVSLSVLLLLVAVYYLLRFCLYPFFLIDRDAPIMESYKASFAATKSQFWSVLGIVVSVGLLTMLITFIVALFFVLLAMKFQSLAHNFYFQGIAGFVTGFIGYFLSWWFLMSLAYAYDILLGSSAERIMPTPEHFM